MHNAMYDHGTYILDGNSEIGAHVRRNICYLICSRHLIKSRAVTNQKKNLLQKGLFLYAYATCSELSSYLSTILINIGYTCLQLDEFLQTRYTSLGRCIILWVYLYINIYIYRRFAHIDPGICTPYTSSSHQKVLEEI